VSGSTRRAWTDVEIESLRRWYADERTDLISQALGRPVSSVHRKANAMGLRKSRELIIEMARERTTRPGHGSHAVRFQPGLTPWNKGSPGTTGRHPNTAAHHYTAGNISGRAAQLLLPIGTLRVNSDGVLERKVTELPGGPHLRWHPVHRLVWEAANGPVPQGHLVVFRPGRKTTELEKITMDALELVTRAENMRRNSVHSKYPPELARLAQLRGVLSRAINKRTKDAETT